MAWELLTSTWPTVDLSILKQLARDQEVLGAAKFYSAAGPLLSPCLASSNIKWGRWWQKHPCLYSGPWCLSTHKSSVPSAGHPMSQEWCSPTSLSLSPCPDLWWTVGKATPTTRTPGKLSRLTLSSEETRCRRPKVSLWVVSTALLCRIRAFLVPHSAP